MRKYIFIILALGLSIYFSGCGKKQQPLEEMQAPMSIESLSTISTESKATAESKTQEAAVQATPAKMPKLESLPPAGPYKPTAQEIQTALKNAGYYTANIDGKIGPLTNKAIKEFQKANALEVDGKVGPKTWAVLSKYLNTVSLNPVTKTKR